MIRLTRSLRLDETLRHRNFQCQHYDECLVKAAKLKWRSFSCIGCSEADLEKWWNSLTNSERFAVIKGIYGTRVTKEERALSRKNYDNLPDQVKYELRMSDWD